MARVHWCPQSRRDTPSRQRSRRPEGEGRKERKEGVAPLLKSRDPHSPGRWGKKHCFGQWCHWFVISMFFSQRSGVIFLQRSEVWICRTFCVWRCKDLASRPIRGSSQPKSSTSLCSTSSAMGKALLGITTSTFRQANYIIMTYIMTMQSSSSIDRWFT